MGMEPNHLVRLLGVHRGMLLGYILAIVRDAHLAEDILQDASLVILEKGHVLAGDHEFPAWARKVVRLEALNALRKHNKNPDLLEPALLDLLEPEWARGAPSNRSLLALRECMKEIPEKAQRLIDLRYVAGLSGKTLAARLNQPPNTVYVALSRIYRTLSACVKKRLACEG